MKSEIRFVNQKPYILIDEQLHAPMAYTTYFEECGTYAQFAQNGYKMFFVNVSFTALPINNATNFTPFRTGVFETDIPDYSEFDNRVASILQVCEDALIFPRINIAMPTKWVQSHPQETVQTQSGTQRESLYSDAFLHDADILLQMLVAHIRSSAYKDRIAGYQICGGTTQEWMHHDLFGSFSDMGMQKFKAWMKDNHGIENVAIPTREDCNSGTFSEQVKYFGLFSTQMAAQTVDYFADRIKEYTNREQIVGAFYGYNAFVCDFMWGLHGLRHLLDSNNIDFFSSPCCYDNNRSLGVDWGDMFPVDSVKLHRKLCFIECDIRTHLTKRMQDSRPGAYPDHILPLTDANGNKTVWSGPDTLPLSISALRKTFAHQITKASGVWWFDMWGGWYNDGHILQEMQAMQSIAQKSVNKDTSNLPHAETALFIDEAALMNLPRSSPMCHSGSQIRVAMGNTGIPFDIYMIEDAQRVLPQYKAVLFTAPLPSETGKNAIRMCEKLQIPYLCADTDRYFFSTSELRDFLISRGIHCYNAENCVINTGNGFLGVHSVKDGEIRITLPKEYKLHPLFADNREDFIAKTIHLPMKKHETLVFELQAID